MNRYTITETQMVELAQRVHGLWSSRGPSVDELLINIKAFFDPMPEYEADGVDELGQVQLRRKSR